MRRRSRLLLFVVIAALAMSAGALVPMPAGAVSPSDAPVFINELHYDNSGTDIGEFVEVAGPAGTDLAGWSIVLYNGNGGAPYATAALAGLLPDQDDGFGTVAVQLAAFGTSGIQNGSPDGVALVDDAGIVVEFISYEGSFAAVGGPADGLTSTDIGVSEASDTAIGSSLSRTGSGSLSGDFAWQAPAAESPGLVNTGQDFGAVAPEAPVISEIHYDNTGSDIGEFVEVEGPAGTDLAGWTLVPYNGNGGTQYSATALSGSIDDEGAGRGAVSFPIAGLQNGSPDGVALVDPGGVVVEFLSYEGSFTATDGPANGSTSTDIGVSEPGSTPIGESLQLVDGVWTGPTAESPGVLNTPAAPEAPVIAEIHYDNAGGDVGEFVEVEGPAGTDLTDWSIVLYNGSNGTAYDTIVLSGSIDDEGSGRGAVSFLPPGGSIQNGSPDGLALVDSGGVVLEFLSYEGTLTATDGPASGLTSTDLGVSESSSTPVGQSLQLLDGAWTGPAPDSPGDLNSAAPPPVVLIHDVQGPGDVSPLVGQIVTISGIVVGDFQEIVTGAPGDEPLDGFFVQEEDGDADADPNTSNGIFVFAPSGAAVSVGDQVEVTGSVTEFFGLTEINNVTNISVVSSNNVLPTPATPIVPTSLADSPVDWEAIEGMRAVFNQDLFVSGLFPHGSFGEIQLSAIGAQDHPNQVAPVGSQAAADQRQLNTISRVILDDGEDENESFPGGLSTWNPTPTPYLDGPEGTIRAGDVVNNLVGVVHYAFGEYEIQPINSNDATDPDGGVSITRTPRPATVPDVGGDLTVASFNVLNYFTTIDNGQPICGPAGNEQRCRGADTQAEFDLQSAKIAAAIDELDADIVGLIELENSGTDAAIADLVAKVNALSARTYDYVPTGFIGTDAIAVGFIYDTGTVDRDGGFAVLDSAVSGAFIDTKNRPALAQTFTDLGSGGNVTIAVNHLKSKGSACDDVANPGDPAFGVDPFALGDDVDVDPLGDPLFTGNCNLTRTAAAKVLGQWLAGDPTGAPSENLLVLGDLNAYATEDPITELEGQGYTDLLKSFNGGSTSWADGGHSFVFDGEFGTLDYSMANPALLPQVTGAAAWHINADEPFAIDYQNFNPPGQATPDQWKSSDHDPVLVGLSLGPPPPSCNGVPATIIGTDAGERIQGTSGPDVILALGGNDTIFGNGGDDLICAGDGKDRVFGGDGDDTIFGEGGRDSIWGQGDDDVLDGGDDRDSLRGGDGEDTLRGGPDRDRLFGDDDDDELDGGAGEDQIHGGKGDDVAMGGDHDDQVFGGGGNDTLTGGDGDDKVFGGGGDDGLDGGPGWDLLNGGSGSDTCTTGEALRSCEL